jgi:SAM-dependent methyltransferase
MSIIEHIHGKYVANRRVRVLSDHLSELIPYGSTVLDVGCGDGNIASTILSKRPDIELKGIDVLMRERPFIPVSQFDGRIIPYGVGFFDLVMMVDVLHHTEDPPCLLREAARVARKSVLIKDHTRDGAFALPTLQYMDSIGNERYHVALPFQYYSQQEWLNVISSAGLKIEVWKSKLGLYPWPAKLIFDRSLHFIARLNVG